MDNHRKALRFVIIPKVDHPWFEEVRRGALRQAHLLQEKLGDEISVDYVPPARAGVKLQNSVLAEVAATMPSGILIDPVDVIAKMPAMAATREQGVPVVSSTRRRRILPSQVWETTSRSRADSLRTVSSI